MNREGLNYQPNQSRYESILSSTLRESTDHSNIMTAITNSQLLIMLIGAFSSLQLVAANTQTCNCFESNVKFDSCNNGQSKWRRHDHPDIGLHGDCLPDVPAK